MSRNSPLFVRMEVVHRDIIQIGLARECMFLAKRKMQLLVNYSHDMEFSPATTALQNDVSLMTKRWNTCFLDLVKSTVHRETMMGHADYDRILKVFRHSMLCEHVTKGFLHLSRGRRVLDSFNLQTDVGVLDTILTGGII